MTRTNFLRLLVIGSLCFSQTSSYNILITFPVGGKSQKIMYDVIGQELVKRGHEVTMFSMVPEPSKIKGVTNIYGTSIETFMSRSGNFTYFSSTMDGLFAMKWVTDIIFMVRDATYEHPEFRRLWEDPSAPKYDLLIVDAIFNEFVLPVAHRLNIPTMYISPGVLFNGVHYNLNIPYPYSYLPSGLGVVYKNLDFLERAKNAWENLVFFLVQHWYLVPQHDKFLRMIFPNAPSLFELQRNVSFVLIHTHPAFNPAAPSMPYTAEIACVHCRPSEKLPEELLNYFENSGDAGVIYFSLGSVTKGDQMPLEMRDKIVGAFSKLPQRILWKYEKPIERLPKNVKLTSWAPQQDILGHPKLRLFITHGGGLSTFEAAYHGCPVLGFPLSMDQLANVGHCVNVGLGEQLQWRTFTAEELVDKINLILTNKRYKEKALSLSKLLRDQPQPPVEKAVYWIEYVIRNRGARHLKSAADKLNFFQYFLLDVLGAVVLVSAVMLTLVYFMVRKIGRLVCGKLSARAAQRNTKRKMN